jgi:hypothetical protein
MLLCISSSVLVASRRFPRIVILQGFVLAHLISMPDQVHLQVAREPLGDAEPVALEISRGFVGALSRSPANGSV